MVTVTIVVKTYTGRLYWVSPLGLGIREGFLEEVAWESALDGLIELARGRTG